MIIQLQLNHCLGHAARQSRIPRRLAPIPFSPRDGPHEGRSEEGRTEEVRTEEEGRRPRQESESPTEEGRRPRQVSE